MQSANIHRSREQCKQTCLICIAEAPPDMWPQAKYRRSRELAKGGATGYVAAGQISQKPRAMQMNLFNLQLPRRNRICGEAKYRRSRELAKGGATATGPLPGRRRIKDSRIKISDYG